MFLVWVLFFFFPSYSIKIPYFPRSIDPDFTRAQNLIYEESSDSLLIIQHLMDSQCAEAKALLGELYLLGEHVEVNTKLALDYFQQAYTEGSAEAGFYLYIILQQSQYFSLEELDLPELQEKTLLSLYKNSINRGSLLMRGLALTQYFQCNSDVEIFFFPFQPEIGTFCSHTVEEILNFSLELASFSINQVISQGREYIIPPAIDETTPNTFSLHGLIQIALKSELDADTLFLIAESYAFGNPILGVLRNLTESIGFYEKSAELGYKESHEALVVIYILLKKYEKALEHLEKALKLSSVHALNSLVYLNLY